MYKRQTFISFFSTKTLFNGLVIGARPWMEETIFFKNDVDVLTHFIRKVREKSKEFSSKFDLFIKIPYFLVKILKFEIFN